MGKKNRGRGVPVGGSNGKANGKTNTSTMKENPFENIKQKRRYDVLGSKQQVVKLSKGRSNQIQQRKETLLVDYYNKDKHNQFIDNRNRDYSDPSYDRANTIKNTTDRRMRGSYGPADESSFEAAHGNLIRSDKDYQKLLEKSKKLLKNKDKSKKDSIYNLKDTYQNRLIQQAVQSHNDEDQHDDAMPDSKFVGKDDALEPINFSSKRTFSQLVEEMQTGTGVFAEGAQDEPQRKKTKKEIYQEIIAKSKLRKYLNKLEKDEQMEVVDQLDDQYKGEMVSFLNQFNQSRKLLAAEDGKVEVSDGVVSKDNQLASNDEQDDYDKALSILMGKKEEPKSVQDSTFQKENLSSSSKHDHKMEYQEEEYSDNDENENLSIKREEPKEHSQGGTVKKVLKNVSSDVDGDFSHILPQGEYSEYDEYEEDVPIDMDMNVETTTRIEKSTTDEFDGEYNLPADYETFQEEMLRDMSLLEEKCKSVLKRKASQHKQSKIKLMNYLMLFYRDNTTQMLTCEEQEGEPAKKKLIDRISDMIMDMVQAHPNASVTSTCDILDKIYTSCNENKGKQLLRTYEQSLSDISRFETSSKFDQKHNAKHRSQMKEAKPTNTVSIAFPSIDDILTLKLICNIYGQYDEPKYEDLIQRQKSIVDCVEILIHQMFHMENINTIRDLFKVLLLGCLSLSVNQKSNRLCPEPIALLVQLSHTIISLLSQSTHQSTIRGSVVFPSEHQWDNATLDTLKVSMSMLWEKDASAVCLDERYEMLNKMDLFIMCFLICTLLKQYMLQMSAHKQNMNVVEIVINPLESILVQTMELQGSIVSKKERKSVLGKKQERVVKMIAEEMERMVSHLQQSRENEVKQRKGEQPVQYLKKKEKKTFHLLVPKYENLERVGRLAGTAEEKEDEQKQYRILKKKIQRERRAAIREIKRDTSFVRTAKEQFDSQQQYERKLKYKKAVDDIQQQNRAHKQLDLANRKFEKKVKQMRKSRKTNQ